MPMLPRRNKNTNMPDTAYNFTYRFTQISDYDDTRGDYVNYVYIAFIVFLARAVLRCVMSHFSPESEKSAGLIRNELLLAELHLTDHANR